MNLANEVLSLRVLPSPSMFSSRMRWNAPINALAAARSAHRGRLLDLSATNPTQAQILYPNVVSDELAEAFARGARAPYEPHPRGLPSARKALAEESACDPDDLVLTSSTSEAYSFLLKLLCDPGDAVITAIPSYPLLEHLTALESVELQLFPMELQARWEIHDVPTTNRTRAIIVVNPNNPTGSFVSPVEQDAIASRGLPIISDEVFFDYPLDGEGTSIVRHDLLTFTLGGLSKSAGLPHLKLAWIRLSGPSKAKAEAAAALELIADSFLSVATPVQVALPEILRVAPRIRDEIRARIRANLDTLREELAPIPSIRILPVEGGWSAVLRVPRLRSDEDLALTLLHRGVLIQPGYFFDFEGEGWVVVSLLTPPDTFVAGISRIKEVVGGS